MDMGRFEEAISDYTTALQLAPDSPTVHFNRGARYHAQGDLLNALADFGTAIFLDSSSAAAWYSLGEDHQDLGELDLSVTD